MRVLLSVLTAVITALLLAFHALTPARADEDLPRVLLISVDGLMPSRYTNAAPAKIPTLRRLMSEGVYADGVIGVMPTVTYPSHTALITGLRPAAHGILDNRIFDPEGLSNTAWYWYAEDIKAPTLPMAARARGLRAGSVSWPVTVGMDLDYVIPEFWRSDHPETMKLLKSLSWPRDLIVAAEAAQGRPFGWPNSDRDRTDVAKFIVRTYQPHLMMLHLIELDSAAHETGPDSTESAETLERLDGYIREVLETLQSVGLAERTNVAVVSDHGFLPVKQQVQPNAALKEEGLVKVDQRGRIVSWEAVFHASGGSGFVYLKEPQNGPLLERVHGILKKLQADPANGIRRIWTRTELDALGAHPGASFGLDVIDGFYTANAHDRLVAPASSKGGHGFDPSRPALYASFIASGPAITRRGSIGTIRITQIAPTLARILGTGLSPMADEPLTVGK